jgi:hypothetical protein
VWLSHRLRSLIECGLEAPYFAEIIDLSGRTIFSINDVRNSIDVAVLNNGMYLLKLSSAGHQVVTRFMVQR